MSTASENKKVMRQCLQAFNERDRKAFDACYADEIVVHNRNGDRTLNHETHWEEVQRFFNVFPDYYETLLGMAAEGDHVFLYWAGKGTHLGKGSNGIEPTGREAEWWAFGDYRLEDGKIVEVWQISDSFDIYHQLGLVEPPGA